jgi:hypothetical protein
LPLAEDELDQDNYRGEYGPLYEKGYCYAVSKTTAFEVTANNSFSDGFKQ